MVRDKGMQLITAPDTLTNFQLKFNIVHRIFAHNKVKRIRTYNLRMHGKQQRDVKGNLIEYVLLSVTCHAFSQCKRTERGK